MLRRGFAAVIVGLGTLLFLPVAARAALATDDGQAGGEPGNSSRFRSGPDFVEARQYQLPEARVAGGESARQTVSAWQVSQGNWNGESLDGLSMVLVQTMPEDGRPRTTNCYISYLATPGQRSALLRAYLATQELKSSDAQAWRTEPAVIRFEFEGHSVIVHLGQVA